MHLTNSPATLCRKTHAPYASGDLMKSWTKARTSNTFHVVTAFFSKASMHGFRHLLDRAHQYNALSANMNAWEAWSALDHNQMVFLLLSAFKIHALATKTVDPLYSHSPFHQDFKIHDTQTQEPHTLDLETMVSHTIPFPHTTIPPYSLTHHTSWSHRTPCSTRLLPMQHRRRRMRQTCHARI